MRELNLKRVFVFKLCRISSLALFVLFFAACTTTPDGKPVSGPAPAVEDEPSKPEVDVIEEIPRKPEIAEEVLSRVVFIYRNDERLLHVYPGMGKKAVHRIMSGYRTRQWRNPCWTEKRIGRNGRVHEIEFYIVRKPTRTRPMGLRVMMPIIYDTEGRVDAVSRYRLKKLRERTHLVTKNRSGCPVTVRPR